MYRRIQFILLTLACIAPANPKSAIAAESAEQCVVLLHGLARTERSMRVMADGLRDAGFIVENIGYPSRKHDVDVLATLSVAEGFRRCALRTDEPTSFVTHSLGGLLVRYFMKANPQQPIGRVVMLGPPNKGSQVVDRLKNVPGFIAFNGPVGGRLGTADTDLPAELGPVNFDLGVVAGTRSFNLLLSRLLPNPDDGKVSVANTRVDGMCDFITLPVSHVFMMRSPKVISHCVSFLRTGQFTHDTPSARLCD